MSKKLIAVFGATGAQGGSVLKSLLNSGSYYVKALTRNDNSNRAKQLASLKNCKVVETDLENVKSLENALKDCYGSFLVTDFASHLENKEIQQGKNAIDSAVKSGVKHLVFSGLENVQSVLGKPCFHFDFKAEIENYGLSLKDKINFTSIRLPAYYENFGNLFLTKINENEYLVNAPMGTKYMYSMSVQDYGPCVKAVFENPNEYKSKIIGVAADKLKMDAYIEILNKHLKPVKFIYGNISVTQYAAFGFPGAVDIANMFEFYQLERMSRDIELTKKLNKDLLDFNSWVLKNKDDLIKNLPN